MKQHPLTNKPKINQIIRQLMAEVGITEAGLARKADIPQPTLHRILSGSTRSPRADSLSRLATFFSISISQLVGDAPLPKDRIPGAHNPNVQAWTTLPLISWEQSCNWHTFKEELRNHSWNQWITTDADVSENSYALIVKGEAMCPRFPEGTTLIVDPDLKAEDGDFIVIKLGQQKQATFKQLLLDGEDKYLKPLNPEFNTILLQEPYEILGIMVQARMNYRSV